MFLLFLNEGFGQASSLLMSMAMHSLDVGVNRAGAGGFAGCPRSPARTWRGLVNWSKDEGERRAAMAVERFLKTLAFPSPGTSTPQPGPSCNNAAPADIFPRLFSRRPKRAGPHQLALQPGEPRRSPGDGASHARLRRVRDDPHAANRGWIGRSGNPREL